MSQNNDSKPDGKQPSPTVTFYNGDNAIGNAMGSRADREGFNSGRYNDRQNNRER